jgi:hydrogenase maturation protein HypF
MAARDSPPAEPDRVRRLAIRVDGIVQGVGFRPFVARQAALLQLSGFVGNDPAGVFVEAEGDEAALTALLRALETGPPLARVGSVRAESRPPGGDSGFRVVASERAGEREALVAADTATCADCLVELRDPADRRFGYPFINCTNCGPRLTIVRDVPYDRVSTTMAAFPMCDACRREYEDPADRRFHAEPVCCPACGPRLRLLSAAGAELPDGGDVIVAAASLLRDGAVVAVKGLGGYHLAALATSEAAVSTLRRRKHREDRPFALMAADVAAVRRICEVAPGDEPVLTGAARPIVLLPKAAGVAGLAAAIAPRQTSLGVMLPYTPVHHLLLAAVAAPLVLTSGNVSDEPIAFDDDDALARLGPLVEAFLTSDRPIRTRVDDSVVRSEAGRPLPVRRSRGFVPVPLELPVPAARPILACGPELKNTFCLARGRHAFVSHHIGDLENYETLCSYLDGIEHFRRLFAVEPAVIAHDLHPEYLSTKHALEMAEDDPALELTGVQHHHAHIASCLADNGTTGPVLGVAFDGLGMGTDGTLWGGEFLAADLTGFERLAQLRSVPMPGGALAVRQPWRMAASYASACGLDLPDLARRHPRWSEVQQLAAAGVNSPSTSSAGRLFDAVAALLGVRDEVTYEGQAAVELEQLADPAEAGAYRARLRDGPGWSVCAGDLFVAAAEDLAAGLPVARIATRFHRGLADAVVGVCERLRAETGLATVALSGGVFQNVLLLRLCETGLREAGVTVLTHRNVPPNDGGISFGQAAVAAARTAESPPDPWRFRS